MQIYPSNNAVLTAESSCYFLKYASERFYLLTMSNPGYASIYSQYRYSKRVLGNCERGSWGQYASDVITQTNKTDWWKI